MAYRFNVQSMDKDTVLFVRQNKTALAYHWDYYRNAVSSVAKHFLNDPPSAVYYKAADHVNSWVVMKDAVVEGYYKGCTTIPEACYETYASNNCLVSNLNINIPAAQYIDAEGYVYTIAPNDGSDNFSLTTKFTVGGEDSDDIKIDQYSISNPNLDFSQRHLMDDIRLTFKASNVTRENTIVTLNSIIVPTINDLYNPQVSYIRNALRMSSYNTNDITTNSYELPLNARVRNVPISLSKPPILHHITKNLYFIAFDYIYRILRDGTIWRASINNNSFSFTQLPIPVLFTYDENPTDTTYQDTLFQGTLIVPIPGSQNTILAFNPDFLHTIELTENYFNSLYYGISTDGGLTYNRYKLKTILPDVSIIAIYPIPYPPFDSKIIIAAIDSEFNVTYLKSSDGMNWSVFTFPENAPLPFDATVYVDYTVKEIFNHLQTLYTDSLSIGSSIEKNLYIDSVGRCIVKTNEGWEPFALKESIKTNIYNRIMENTIAGDDVLRDHHLTCVYEYDVSQDLLLVPYCFIGKNNENVPSFYESGIEYYGRPVSIQNAPPLKKATRVNKTLREVVQETNQQNYDTAHGAHTVFFNSRGIIRYKGKWIIRDILSVQYPIKPVEYPDNIDVKGGYRFRISEDCIHWYPFKGIEGEKYEEDSDIAVLYYKGLKLFLFVNDNTVYPYDFPLKTPYHYDLRVTVHKWNGVKLSQQIQALYIVDSTSNNKITHSIESPLKVGFPININPNAFIILYNGMPLLNEQAHVNPENDKEILLERFQREHILQRYINPIQYTINNRQFVYNDFTLINANAIDSEMECILFVDKAKVIYVGKEYHAIFNSKIEGDLILFNGINHEYIITGKMSIKYIVSRFGLHEERYPESPYFYIGNYHMRNDVPMNIYKLQFITRPKRQPV